MYRLTITILTFLDLAVMIFLIFILTNNHYEQKSYTYTELNFDYERYDLTQEQAVELCSSLVGSYKIVWNNDVHYSGLAVIPLQHCFINKYQTGWQLLETLTHEFIHLKYWAVNETYTQFMTFKLLYESENVVLHNKGIEIAVKQLGGAYSGVYDCSWYINEYLGDAQTNAGVGRKLLTNLDKNVIMLKE